MSIGFPDWGGQPALAQAITSIDIPTQTITPNNFATFTGQITRLGYEIEISLIALAASAVTSPIEIQLQWVDSVTGQATAMQRFFAFPGVFGGARHTIMGQGPSAANLLHVTVVNANAAGPSIDCQLIVQDVARIYTRHDWRSRDDNFPAFQGFAVTDHDLFAHLLAGVTNLALPAATNQIYLLPLFTGEFQIKAFFSANVTFKVLVETVAHSNPNLNGTTVEIDSPGGSVVMITGYMPRVQSQLKLENTAAATATNVFLQMIVAENT